MIYYIVTAEALNFRLIRHKAILFEQDGKLYVTHKNENGAHLESLYDFLASGRKLLSKEAHQCKNAHQVRIYFAEHKDEEFNLLLSNCEHYVSGFRKQNGESVFIQSPQVAAVCFLFLAAVVLVGYYYWLRK